MKRQTFLNSVYIREELKPSYDRSLPKTDDSTNPSVSSLKFIWLDSREAAQFLKVSVGELRNMTSNGCIPFYKLGRRNRYRQDELEALLLKQKRGPHGN